MKFNPLVSKASPLFLLAVALCVRAADTPTVTVKGYVLQQG